jgi:cathepsin A (carboxypeptidase C)
MNGDWMKPFVDNIPPLLEQGIRVLIYAGDAGISLSIYC